MAVNIPKLTDLYSDILSNLESELGVTLPLFGKIFLRATAAVQAAKLWLFYKAIASVQKNIFVDTAESESTGGTLERFGRVKLGRSPFSAQSGTYAVTVTGVVAAVIPVNTTYKSNDDSKNPGKLYILDSQHIIVVGINTINLRSLEGGLDVQLDNSDELTLTSPIVNVDAVSTVTSEVIIPLAAEDLEDYRAKSIEAYQLEPQGGASSDYRIWSADAQSVKRVYPYAKSGFSNEAEIFVEATIADSIDGKGTPSAALLIEVEDVVEFDPDVSKPLSERGRMPMTVFNIDFNPVAIREVDIEITNYTGLTAEIETSIFNAIESALADIRPFVSAADVLANQNDFISVFKLIFLVQQAEPSSIFDSLVMKIDTVSLSTFTFIGGDIPHLNSITYV